MFKGSYVAIVTPFSAKSGSASGGKNGKIDEKKFAELIEFHIKNGTDGIVPAGCTGEAATLNHEEQKHFMKFTCEVVNKRVSVVAGAGSNSTEEAVALTRHAKKVGCDAVLSITPYYNKPTPEGQFRHYREIAKVGIPVMVYNVPSRTGICMTPQTIARLSVVENIVAVKEASGSLDQVSQILALCNITVLSGDDSLTLPMMAVGAKGVVSVVANIIPREIHDMVFSFLEGDTKKAKDLHYKTLPLCKAMFIETNPIPVKTSMKLLKMLNGELRLPLCEMQKENEPKLRKALQKYGLL